MNRRRPPLCRAGLGTWLALALLVIISCVAAGSPWAAAAGPVAYTALEGKLATVNPDGTDYRVLVSGGGPAWSSSGRWIAYAHEGEIWRIRPDGTGATRVLRFPGGAADPSWSPAGRRLAFTVELDTGAEIGPSAVYVAQRDGSGKRMVRRNASQATWSPDGRTIVLRTAKGIATVRPNGNGFGLLRRVTAVIAGRPQFSPDGRWVLFLTYTREATRIAATRTNLLNVRTGRLRRIPLRMMRGSTSDATWTPRGEIAFLHFEWTRQGGVSPGTPARLKTIRRDGTHPRTLAVLKEWPLGGGGLSWRPTG
jgi:Tol biopolymer transport system component